MNNLKKFPTKSPKHRPFNGWCLKIVYYLERDFFLPSKNIFLTNFELYKAFSNFWFQKRVLCALGSVSTLEQAVVIFWSNWCSGVQHSPVSILLKPWNMLKYLIFCIFLFNLVHGAATVLTLNNCTSNEKIEEVSCLFVSFSKESILSFIIEV